MERAAITRPAKLERISSSKISSIKSAQKPKISRSRNPLKELNSGYLPPSQSREGSRRGCFSRPLSNSSASSTSVSSKINVHPVSMPRPRTPTSAPANSGATRSLKSRNLTRPSFKILKHSGSDRVQRPAAKFLVQKLSGASMDKRGKPTAEMSQAYPRLGADSEKDGAAASSPKLSYRSNLIDRDEEKEDQIEMQISKTPTSARTATPPVQATISPEFSSQSMLPTPACFAAGHLLTGVQDRRKCRPRGILNGGNSGFDIADSNSSRSVRSSSKARSSFTPPLPLGASVQWHSSPSNSKLCLAEASVSWVLSPKESSTGKFTLQNFTPNSNPLNSSGTTPSSDRYLLYPSPSSSSTLQKTTPALEICRSPASSSSLSPFSMILQKASSMPQDQGRCHYLSPAHNSPCSPDSQNNSNVMCTPSCSSSDKNVREISTIDSSPLPFLDESFHFGCSLSPLSSADLSRFQRSPFLPNSPKKKSDLKGESLSEMRISWREGLISRIFSMHELSHCFWSPEREEPKLECTPRSSEFSKVSGQSEKLGFGSFEFSAQTPCAESLGIEEHCMTSSDDSDWTLFFRNQLFED